MLFYSFEGLQDYSEIRDLQLELIELRSNNAISDLVLFLEHSPVFTRGSGIQNTVVEEKGLSSRHGSVSLIPPEYEVIQTERGGDLTYHGPGQLVVYPIIKLTEGTLTAPRDVADYLRKLEKICVEVVQSLGVKARVEEGASGIWVGSRKLASVGIAVRKWVSFHGIAINVTNDLKPFYFIEPCGFSPDLMIRLLDCVENLFELTAQNPRKWLEGRFAQTFLRALRQPSAQSTATVGGTLGRGDLKAFREWLEHRQAIQAAARESPSNSLANSAVDLPRQVS